MESLTERLKILASQGYEQELFFKNSQPQTTDGRALDINKTKIDATYRIEDDSDPNNQTIVYALSSIDPEVKMLLISSYGPNFDENKYKFIEAIA